MFTVTRYHRRNWAVYSPSGELICVTLYRKGAQKVADMLSSATAQPATPYVAA